MALLEDPFDLGGVILRNRLYRAPLLEVARNDPEAVRILLRELYPAARGGCGLIFQGACIVTPEGGRTAPGLTRVHDPSFVRSLSPVVQAIHEAGARIFLQLGHGGLESMEVWNDEYRRRHPHLRTLSVSPPPLWFRNLVHIHLLRPPHLHVLTTEEIYALARAFAQAARNAYEAGYDGIHLAGANGSIFQEFWSAVFNKRRDEFGGRTVRQRSRFFEVVVREIRQATSPNFPITTKVPAEVPSRFLIRGTLTRRDGIEIARVAQELGVAGVAPVEVGITRDQTVARGRFPSLAWKDPRFQKGYRAAFGKRLPFIRALHLFSSWIWRPKPVWNRKFFSSVKREVEGIAVLAEGGIRTRREIDLLLKNNECDLVGMARPFYAEPWIAYRILHEPQGFALCASCNNCTVPQVAGGRGTCRTPSIVRRRGEFEKEGRYGWR